MKNFKYEGFYHYMHNPSTGIFSLTCKEKISIFSLKISMDEEKARRSRRQPILYKAAVEIHNNFKGPLEETS
jgi:hypothetical protein